MSEEMSFSGKQISKVSGIQNIITYHQLARMNSLDEVLGLERAVVILYETRRGFGHWVCLHAIGDTVEFFDSYGLHVDEELKFVPKTVRHYLGESTPHLTALIHASKLKLVENTYQLQEFMEHINTCGRWVSARIRLKKMKLPHFIEFFVNTPNKTPDEVITIYTERLLLDGL